VAVLLVVAYHASAVRGHTPRLHGGFVGVDVFFVLSGFLITSILLRQGARPDVWRFYRRRFWRLYPGLALMCVTVLLWFSLVPDSWVADPSLKHDQGRATLWALSYLSAWPTALGGAVGYLGHTWSLSVEEHFYLLWPLTLIVLARLAPRHRTRGVALLVLVAACWPALMAALGADAARLYPAPDTRAVELLVGCLLACLLRAPRRRAQVLRWCGQPLLLTALAFLGAVTLLVHRQSMAYLAVGQPVVAAAAAVVIAHLVLRESWATRLLSHPAAVTGGAWSYGIYLWHRPLLAVPYPLLGDGYGAHAVGAVVAVFLAAASYRWVEQPLQRRFSTGQGGAVLVPAQPTRGPEDAVAVL
jgi:peptidoglycan/LPS O-acetylase OafA/YrhL